MPFLGHLAELRGYIITCLFSVGAGTLMGFLLFDRFVPFLINKYGQNLFVNSPAEAFITQLNLSFAFGVFISIPVALTCIVMFILPALGRNEKVVLFTGAGAALLLFAGGLIYSYFVMLPVSLKFLLNPAFFPEHIKTMLNYTSSLNFVLAILLAFSLSFEFPVLLYILLHFNILTVKTLMKNFKYAVLVIFIIAAIITPPDAISQLMLALPCILLFLLTILAAKFTGAGKGKAG